MITRQGDLFTTDAYFIGHGCNMDGVMGAGVAKTVRAKFPLTYADYERRCHIGVKPGQVHAFRENGKMILNLFTQDRPGANARYEWVFLALLTAADNVSKMPSSRRLGPKLIAIPQIGCGIGGLSWSGVRAVIFAVEAIVPDVQFEVWEYKP